QSYAAFAQGSFKLTNQLSLTGGLRYTSEDKELFIDVRGLAGQVIVPAQTARASYENWTPRIGLEYQATDDLLAYASYSKGFKSGGFNIRY
ncbi:TonB-dependent receptor, partial [Listeria monocytogenes]